MIFNKKMNIFFIILISIFFLYFIFNSVDKQHKEKTQHTTPQNLSNHIDNKITVDTQNLYLNSQSNQTNNISNTKQLQQDDSPPEYLVRLQELQELQKKNPTVVLSIDELSPEQQTAMKEWLLSYQEKGYISVTETAFDYMELQHTQAEFLELNDQSIVVPLQDIDKTKLSEYEYKGVILDQIEGNEALPIHGVKRLYTDPNGNEISLYEKSSTNSSSILVKEFVSENINGYPAVTTTLCTENQRCISKITIITSDKSYEIAAKGNQEATKKQLVEIALSLDLPKTQITN